MIVAPLTNWISVFPQDYRHWALRLQGYYAMNSVLYVPIYSLVDFPGFRFELCHFSKLSNLQSKFWKVSDGLFRGFSEVFPAWYGVA